MSKDNSQSISDIHARKKSFVKYRLTLELWHTFAVCTFWKHPVLLLLHTPLNTFCSGYWICLWKSEKRNHQMQRAAFCTKRGNKLTSPKHKLHIFQVKTSTVQDKDLLGNRCHFRHLQHFCSSRAAILLTFLEDNAQNSPSYFSSNIFEILLSYSPILKTMASDQTREANKNMWVICRKRG